MSGKTPFIKSSAGIDEQFESGFFQLAFDKLQSKLGNLLDYFVGFEVKEKSEDNSKAIGVFAFKAENGQILFVPAFYINGKVKDLDLLYSRNNNQFYPLTEDFAELFLRDDVTGMGAVGEGNKQDISKDVPTVDFRNLAVPPRTGRQVMASVIDYVKDSDNKVKTAFWNMLEKDADFTEAVLRFYDKETVAKALVKKAEEVKEPLVKVIKLASAMSAPLPEDMDVDARKELFEKGYKIIDKRTNEQKSKFGQIEFVNSFTNPSENGIYTYVTKAGNLNYGLVFINPISLFKDIPYEKYLVLDLNKDLLGMLYSSETPVFIKDQIHVGSYENIHKMMEEPANGTPSFDDSYILVNEKMKATEPFKIVQNTKDDGIRKLEVEPRYMYDSSSTLAYRTNNNKIEVSDKKDPTRINNFYSPLSQTSVTLVFTKKQGDVLTFHNNIVYVPKGYKLLKVKTDKYFSVANSIRYGTKEYEAERLKNKQKELKAKQNAIGSPNDVLSLLRSNGIFPLTVRTDGSDYFIDFKSYKKKYENPLSAKIGMIMDFGLDETSAENILSSLTPGIVKKGYIKLAVTGERTLPLWDEQPQSDEYGNPTLYGIPWEQISDRSDGYTGDPTRRGLATMPEVTGVNPYQGQGRYNLSDEIQKAVQLASAGQKEIFDTHTIATIAKYIDPTTKVLSYIPSFTTALDNLGRMLFMINWETGKFEEMYGQDELPELMEILKNVFKNLGDLIIFLKRKFPDVSINHSEQDQVGQL